MRMIERMYEETHNKASATSEDPNHIVDHNNWSQSAFRYTLSQEQAANEGSDRTVH